MNTRKDPKQPIYDAMNWLGTAIPDEPPDDRDMLLKAYDKLCSLEDRETRQLFLDVMQRLTFRNQRMKNAVRAWKSSADKLRQACQIIGEGDKTVTRSCFASDPTEASK